MGLGQEDPQEVREARVLHMVASLPEDFRREHKESLTECHREDLTPSCREVFDLHFVGDDADQLAEQIRNGSFPPGFSVSSVKHFAQLREDVVAEAARSEFPIEES